MDAMQDSIIVEATNALMKLSIRELEEKLLRHKVDFSECSQKEELVRKLIDHGAIHDEKAAGQPDAEPEASSVPFSEETLEISGLPTIIVSNAQGGEEIDLLFIILHGHAADEKDLVPFGKELLEHVSASTRSKKIALAFPGAPLSVPGQPTGRAWWHIDLVESHRRLREGTKLEVILAECPPDFKKAAVKMREFIKDLKSRFGGCRKFMLGGFSQGAVLSIQVSLELETAPDVTVILSAVIQNSMEWDTLLKEKGKNLNVIQSHGKTDQLLPFAVAQMLYSMFKQHGVTTEWIEFEGAHSIPPTVIPRVADAMERLVRM